MFETVLAAWMRLKYPHISIGALASSAPILQFEDLVPPDTFYNIVSNDFRVRKEFLSLEISKLTSVYLGNSQSRIRSYLINFNQIKCLIGSFFFF